jgi:hypothetical protein
MKLELKYCFLIYFIFILASCKVIEPSNFTLEGKAYNLVIERNTFKFYFTDNQGSIIVPPHTSSGLTMNGNEVVNCTIIDNKNSAQRKSFLLIDSKGEEIIVDVSFENNIASFSVHSNDQKARSICLRLGAMPYAHGLGDAGSRGESFNLVNNKKSSYPIINNGSTNRWASTFAIFPKNNVAGVYFSEGKKTVSISNLEYSMRIDKIRKAKFYYFVGDLKSIYKNYKIVRDLETFEDVKPKSRLFELGWESWDALGWNTNQNSVKEILQMYLDKDYPIKWAVTGSGFWEEGGTSTSFGKWGEKFSDTSTFKTWMNEQDIKWMIGLRTNFVPSGGPYIPLSNKRDRDLKVNSYYGNSLSDEGLKNSFFVKDGSGTPTFYTSEIFPQIPCYILDGNVPGAANWYLQKYKNWQVDGIKEDTMQDTDSLISIYTNPITKIAKDNGLVMARNGSFVAPGTLLRINDTRVDDMQKRTPINYFQYAASGFPNVYSDVAGIHNMHNMKDVDKNIRHTWLLSLTAGLSVGAYPDKWTEEKQNIFKKAIDFHYSIAPYMYSAAMDSYTSGFPYTLTPLNIAYPKDTLAYELPNFQWMIGESILATPLLKNDMDGMMDIYLPEGIWYDYDTDEKYEGPVLLQDFKMLLNKTPCFVGGKGIVAERKKDRLNARIYPVKKNTSIIFTHLDGTDKSQITVGNVDWDNIKIVDTTIHKEISYERKGVAYIFELKRNHNYKIQ